MKSRYLLSAFIVLLAAILWLGSATDTHAYTTWTSGCTDCHSDLRDATSTKPGNSSRMQRFPCSRWHASGRSAHRDLAFLSH